MVLGRGDGVSFADVLVGGGGAMLTKVEMGDGRWETGEQVEVVLGDVLAATEGFKHLLLCRGSFSKSNTARKRNKRWEMAEV